MGFYIHRGREGNISVLEDLVTGAVYRAIVPAGYTDLHQAELAGAQKSLDDPESEWRRRGATSMHGNPWLLLLRREVEAFVEKRHGDQYLRDRQAQTELGRMNRELKRPRGQTAALEERKSKVIASAGHLPR